MLSLLLLCEENYLFEVNKQDEEEHFYCLVFVVKHITVTHHTLFDASI
jgi:hypothetical protein